MKFAVALIAATLVVSTMALTKEQKIKIKETFATCKKEHNISDELFNKLKNGEYDNVDHNTKCMYKCFFHHLGFMDDTGKIDPETGKKYVKVEEHKDKEFAAIDKCVKESESIKDHCDKAFAMHKCYYENTPHLRGVDYLKE